MSRKWRGYTVALKEGQLLFFKYISELDLVKGFASSPEETIDLKDGIAFVDSRDEEVRPLKRRLFDC